MPDAPLVSVVMPVRDAAAFVREATESILGQTLGELELIVVDDGSTDRSGAIIEALGDPRVRVLRQEEGRGIVAGLNRGLAEARGTYLARMDADDVADPERLRRQVGFLEAHPDVALVGSGCRLIDEGGACLGVLEVPTSPALVGWELLFENPIVHPTVLARRELVGGYAEGFAHAEDYELWARLAERHALANLAEPLLSLRQHGGQVTARHLAAQQESSDRVRARALGHLLRRNVAEVERALWGRMARREAQASAEDARRAATLVVAALRAYGARGSAAGTRGDGTIGDAATAREDGAVGGAAAAGDEDRRSAATARDGDAGWSAADLADVRRRAARRLLGLARVNARRHPAVVPGVVALALRTSPGAVAGADGALRRRGRIAR